MSTIEEAGAALDRRLGPLPTLTFPAGWTTSGSWRRAQAVPAEVSPASNPAEFDLLMGYEDSQEISHHRVTFAIKDGEIVAECPCKGFTFNEWCAHVAHLWWRRVRSDLGGTDLDTGQTHLSPPFWLEVDEA